MLLEFFYNLLSISDIVNRDISIVKRINTTYIIRLSINKDLKLKERKGKEK